MITLLLALVKSTVPTVIENTTKIKANPQITNPAKAMMNGKDLI